MAHILLTGAGGGIGSSIKKALEAQGHTVTGIDRSDADLTSRSGIEALAEKLVTEGTIFDWIVFSHGFIDAETDLAKQSLESMEHTLMLNTLSPIGITGKLLPTLPAGGGVVFISSTAGISPNGRYSTYSASKAALNAFSQALARAYPDKVFIALAPGPTDTAMREKIGGDRAKAQDPQAIADFIARLVAGRTEYRSGDIVVVRDGKDTLHARLD